MAQLKTKETHTHSRSPSQTHTKYTVSYVYRVKATFGLFSLLLLFLYRQIEIIAVIW